MEVYGTIHIDYRQDTIMIGELKRVTKEDLINSLLQEMMPNNKEEFLKNILVIESSKETSRFGEGSCIKPFIE